jgi:hypothetical protein
MKKILKTRDNFKSLLTPSLSPVDGGEGKGEGDFTKRKCLTKFKESEHS